jgi:hypothetical protein
MVTTAERELYQVACQLGKINAELPHAINNHKRYAALHESRQLLIAKLERVSIQIYLEQE